MSQLVGLECRVCGGRIVSVETGRFCSDCRQPVHLVCAGPVAVDGACRVCGAAADAKSLALDAVPQPDASAEAGGLFGWLSFRGRLSRSQYFTHSLVSCGALVGMAIAIGAIDPALAPLGVLVFIVFGVWSEMSATVRRLHDLDRPGWHWVLGLIPIYNMYLGIVLLLQAGTMGDNQYGPDPLFQGVSEADRLLMMASRHEMDGEWSAAFDLYRLAAEKLEGHPEQTYAIECIRRLHEKMALQSPAGNV